MPPKKSPIWKYYVRGEMHNKSHHKVYCLFCIKHHLGPNHPSNQAAIGVPSLSWDDVGLAQAREAAGSVLGVKDSMIAHLIGTNACAYATGDAKKAAKELRDGKAPPGHAADDELDDEEQP
ncbi:hypothetical protein DFH09DRAFT_1392801 [Mycena vulgaris]|nr:hypothetical protein DFH09DRAFT_1392801 [Mycena vulgaris]